jgi:RNA recognition motif-containing protein
MVSMKIYVGNLAYSVNDTNLRELFEEFGEVVSSRVIIDKITGKARGFGFVEMADDAEASRAIESLNGKQFTGRALVVNEARPREEGAAAPRGPRSHGGGSRPMRRY